DKLFVGNLNAKRDWGHAKDYVKAMYLILQQPVAEDYVIATGITTTVRDFIGKSFLEAGVKLRFEGEGANEIGIVDEIDMTKFVDMELTESSIAIGKQVVAVDTAYFRPTEVDLLIGDATKARTKLGWTPEYDLDALVKDMMQSDIELMKKEKFLQRAGFRTLNYFE
ncbi:MAG: GDP-mannose 4,6-dehydratase, partial [Bacteroidota bacterium]|nr:GDP-mannose 4,6-dehydratase [Bacteroidota bacterium]